jgi:tetratricopeptide (TPR) repeat protein
MASGTADNPKILIGASIPRSGHHFLQNLLTSYYGLDLHYCEFYTPPGCCKSIPCTMRGNYRVIFQKSHDRDLKVPTDVGDAMYLLQYRHPVPEALSDRELELRDGLGRRNLPYRRTRENYAYWLANKAIYYRKFHDKWMVRRTRNALYMDYPDLSANPESMLRQIISWASTSVDEQRLSQVVEQAGRTRVSVPHSTQTKSGEEAKVFKPRVIQDSPHFDAELLGAFEAWVLERTPGFGYGRELSGPYENSMVYGLILLNDPEEPLPAGERNRFEAASRRAPGHPEIQRRIVQRLLNEDDIEGAMQRLQETITHNPFYTPAYKLIFSVCKRAGTAVPESILTPDAVIACSDSAQLLADLGQAFLDRGLLVNAVTALSLATAITPDHQRAYHLLAVAMSQEKRWGQARQYAERAVALDGENKSSAKLLSTLQRRA